VLPGVGFILKSYGPNSYNNSSLGSGFFFSTYYTVLTCTIGSSFGFILPFVGSEPYFFLTVYY